jgi:hypothetical protein
MYKPSTYLVVFIYFPTYIWDLFPTKLVTKVKPTINSVEIHPQLSSNEHPVDGVLVGAGSLWPLHTIMVWVVHSLFLPFSNKLS